MGQEREAFLEILPSQEERRIRVLAALRPEDRPICVSFVQHDCAIADLGDSYAGGPGQDDTVTVLTAAKGAVAGKDFQLAAHVKQEVLTARFGMFQKESRMAQRCRSVLQRFGVG